MASTVPPKAKRGGIGPTYIPGPAATQQLQKNAHLGAVPEQSEQDLHKLAWHEFKLKDLQSYRQSYHLDTPSASINPHADLILANAAQKGLYSPSVIAAHRKDRESRKNRKNLTSAPKERSSSRLKAATSGVGKTTPSTLGDSGRQGKELLALAVRKHFNAMSVSEGEVIAKFTYVVRHLAASAEGDQDKADKGFRMRFHT